MKKIIWIILIIVVLAVAGFCGWYFFVKKSPESGACKSSTRCEVGLNCINDKCSSGKIGSTCTAKSDCQSSYCAKGFCTEGEQGNACANYKDCQSGLLCMKGSCDALPDYSKYFSKVTISKMQPGLPPGPDNPTTVTDIFTTEDALEIDFNGVKTTTIGDYYLEIVNATTGEVARSTKGAMDTKFKGEDTGMGIDFSGMGKGQYDINIYFNNALVYTAPITLN